MKFFINLNWFVQWNNTAMSIIQLLLLLLFVQCYSQEPSENRHSLFTEQELQNLFGNYETVPMVETATVSWQKLRRKRYSDFQDEQYHVEAYVKTNSTTLHLQLRQHSEIIAPNFKMTIRHWNFTEEIQPNEIPLPECLYHGHIVAGGQGHVAVSTCTNLGLTGIIINEERYFVLQPLPRRLQDQDKTHFIYEKSQRKTCANTANSMVPPPINDDWDSNENAIDGDLNSKSKHRINRAAKSQRTIETAVFVDDVMYKNVEDQFITDPKIMVRDIVFTIMNSVQLLYNQPTLHTPFKIVLIKLEIITSSKEGPNKEQGDIKLYLTNFCNWQQKKNPANDKSNPDHWDYALMLSGINLFQDKPENDSVIGLAWLSGMCQNAYSCSINEGNSFESAFVITHEIGHNLGMFHDGSNNTCSADGHIMSPSLGPGKITWSSCSENYLNKFLRLYGHLCNYIKSTYNYSSLTEMKSSSTSSATRINLSIADTDGTIQWKVQQCQTSTSKCLDDSASPSKQLDHEADGLLPGQKYSAVEQCKQAFGSRYEVYTTRKKPFDNICRELWCDYGAYAKRAHPALDGSKCASGKICKLGECVTDDRASSQDQRIDIKWREPPTEPSIFSKVKKLAKDAVNLMNKVKDFFG